MRLRIICVLALGALVAPVLADFEMGVTRMDDWWGTLNPTGGEFTIYDDGRSPLLGIGAYASVTKGQRDVTDVHDPGTDYSFQSFCVERREQVVFAADIVISNTHAGDGRPGLATHAFMGGLGDGINAPAVDGDDLDAGSDYLYFHFARGDLTGYDYTPGAGRQASASALQEAIWYLENETFVLGKGFIYDPHDATDAAATLSSDAYDFWKLAEDAGWTATGAVRVLNMYADEGHEELAQDMLYLVPAPAAVMLGVLGLAAVGTLRRRV
jgi:hypothetical protein